ncbi:MAG TPA: DUF47 family protein [Candidatus Angelobacter sp.]|nr:DUF47 family protein [Candidatus Angelobacter sp.]
MFSLQEVFGKADKFFGLLEASAEEARASVQALVKAVKDRDQNQSLDEFVLTRRKEKRITEQISEELVKTFVTALEREDIEALSNALYKIPKTAEKFAERFVLGVERLRDVDFSRHAAMLEKATDTITSMVKQLRAGHELEEMKEQNDRLQYIEGEADKLMLELYRDLYSGRHDPVKVVMLKDLYELLEKVVDRCRDAGNVIYNIVLKNS